MTSLEPYERTLLQGDDDLEVLVMRWRPGATCAPHDHGRDASGVVHLAVGCIVERRYSFDGVDLAIVSERRFEAPAVMAIEAGVVHDMHALGPATTVHVYRPRVTEMRVYDHAARVTWTVPDDHGAWLPQAGADGVSQAPWESGARPGAQPGDGA